MPTDTQTQYGKMVRSPFGMVLCAGPTGSGKTTTLYATLNEIDERSRNVVTIEDPVEYVFPSINQIQTNEQAGITFADGLRAILRQDPDVILVGEIRDTDTARIATQAALTGPLRALLSARHRLRRRPAPLPGYGHRGLPRRLVHPRGRQPATGPPQSAKSCAGAVRANRRRNRLLQGGRRVRATTFVRGAGCQICSDTGYLDRIGVYEFLRMTPEIRRLLVGWATQDELRRVAINQGMRTLRTEGLALVDAGRHHHLRSHPKHLRAVSHGRSLAVPKFRFTAATLDGTVSPASRPRPSIADVRDALLDRNLQPISILEKKSLLQFEITQKKVKQARADAPVPPAGGLLALRRLRARRLRRPRRGDLQQAPQVRPRGHADVARIRGPLLRGGRRHIRSFSRLCGRDPALGRADRQPG